MNTRTITQLQSVNSLEKIQALNSLGVYTVRDMAEYDGCRHAEFVLACFRQGNVESAGLENYIEAEALTDDNLDALDELEIVHLLAVSEADAEQMDSAFGVQTLEQLAEFPPYKEAQEIILTAVRGEFYEKPSAPAALIPKLIGSTHTQARFSNYVKEKEYRLDDYELTYFSDKDEPDPAEALIDIFYRSEFKFYLGYLASVHQKWINAGFYLGEIIHSLALAPGESRSYTIMDWYRRQRSSRREDTTAAERLTSEFLQTRALNEVVQTTANEHLYGSTDVDATTRTTGAGLVGGGARGGAAGGAGSVDLLSLIGLPITLGGSALGSAAGAIGGSLVYSNASVQGTLQSETTGERTVTGELVQNISDSTVQNASNVRSVMSTVIVEDEQSGRQRAQTRNVTNYNHSHALTINYFEMLHRYRIDTHIDSLCPVLFLPFGPITFNIELIKDYWYIFSRAIRRLMPRRFFEYDQVIKDFNPQNEAFDASGDLRVTKVKITRTRSYSEAVRVRLTDSNPEVTLAITGYDMDDSLRLKMVGSSTYVDYDILDIDVNTLSSFGSGSGSVDSFELDEGISASLVSDFTSELKQKMKAYLDDENKTPKVADTNRADNELGLGSNREALMEDVDDNLFSILNNNATVDLTMDFEYTVEDVNGQTQTVLQSIRKTYTYGQLKAEVDEEISDVSEHINTQLATVADINPAEKIAEIEQHFNFHKYGYTKYLLANIEKEQTIDIIDHLGLYGTTETLALTALIDPSPIGLTENLLIFKLREDAESLQRRLGKNFFSAVKAPLFGKDVTLSGHGVQQSTVRKGRSVRKYSLAGQPIAAKGGRNYATANLTLYVDDKAGLKNGVRNVEGTVDLITNIGGKQFTNPVAIQGQAHELDNGALQIQYQASGAIPDALEGTIDWTFEFPRPNDENIAGIVNEYVQELNEYERTIRKKHRRDSVYLPSSGVFAEATLGISNGSEFLNARRFFNWQDSPIPNAAPAILPVNVNQDYTQPIPDSLAPTVPVSVLNQIAPQQYPMPTSLSSALEAIQNGSMFTDMSKTGQLTAILGDLAQLANNTAQLAGNLAGDAAANALEAAVALGQQVAGMVGEAMNSNVADPPSTLTDRGIALEELEAIRQNTNGGSVAPIDQAGAGVVGAPIPSNNGGTTTNGGGVPAPPPTSEEPPPPTYDTSETINGTLKIQAGLPDPYDYARVNLLEILDAFIPDSIDDTLKDIYYTLKDFIIWVGDEEGKKDQATAAFKALASKAKRASGWGFVIGLALDLLTSETVLNLCEDLVVLLYDTVYYYHHPHLGFTGGHEQGSWLAAEIPYSKTRGASAQVGAVATAPFNVVTYYYGGVPVNTSDNPPTWGAEQLSGSWPIYRITTDPSQLNVTVVDIADGNALTLTVDANMEMMLENASIVQAIRNDFMAKVYAMLANWETSTKETIEQVVADWLASLDEGTLDSWLGWMGLPTLAIEAIKAVLAGAGDLWGTVATFGVDVTTFVSSMALSVFNYITGFKDLVSSEPTMVNYHLHLVATVDYNQPYPAGWKLSVAGETSRFPALTVSNTDEDGGEMTVYSKNDIHPLGLLGLLQSCDPIPQKTTYL